MDANWEEQLESNGYYLAEGAYDDDDACRLRDHLTAAIDSLPEGSESIRSRGGQVYAARNILSIFEEARTTWQREPLLSLLRQVLDEGFGLVRGLYFDKHPERSWSLPWHKDLTIAVARNDLPTTMFKNPTKKAGITHVEAPRTLLESMLTLRIHLDTVTEENGPLMVMPGSHRSETTSLQGNGDFQNILANRGDVLAMRPLLTHSSGNSIEGTTCHRRILHLEFAAQEVLPDGYTWHTFLPLGERVR